MNQPHYSKWYYSEMAFHCRTTLFFLRVQSCYSFISLKFLPVINTDMTDRTSLKKHLLCSWFLLQFLMLLTFYFWPHCSTSETAIWCCIGMLTQELWGWCCSMNFCAKAFISSGDCSSQSLWCSLLVLGTSATQCRYLCVDQDNLTIVVSFAWSSFTSF